MLIDTHAHLNMDVFNSDRKEVIQRADEAGVKAIIDIGTDLETSRKAVKIAEQHENVYAAVGCHPHDSVKIASEEIKEIKHLVSHTKVVALGEIGLDYHYDFSPPEVQKKIFMLQLSYAHEQQLPVIIHIREAFEEGLEIIDSAGEPPWRGVFHCFGGSSHDVEEVLKRGFHVSFTGVVSFKNFSKRDVVQTVPIDRLLLETDAPYMAPVPLRGKRNEPAFLTHTAESLADIYQMDRHTLAEMTTANAHRLFNMDN